MPQLEHEEESTNFEKGPIDLNKKLHLNIKWKIERAGAKSTPSYSYFHQPTIIGN